MPKIISKVKRFKLESAHRQTDGHTDATKRIIAPATRLGPTRSIKLSVRVLTWLPDCSEVQTCIQSSWCHCHSLSVVSVKFRLVLAFWYLLTWLVPDKRPLNRCCHCCYLQTLSVSDYKDHFSIVRPKFQASRLPNLPFWTVGTKFIIGWIPFPDMGVSEGHKWSNT